MQEIFKEEIITCCKGLYDKDLIAGCDGNVSVRLNNRCILITPRGKHKGFLTSDEIAIVDIGGNILKGTPTSELAIHLKIYRDCPLANAIIHAHPITATAWTITGDETELPAQYLTESMYGLVRVPFVEYAPPGTQTVAEKLSPFLPACQVLLLKHHGSVAWGRSLDEAFCLTEHLEHIAKTLHCAKQLGSLRPIPLGDKVHERV